jgi:hypothetical protein
MASAPFSTAAFAHSQSPAGASNSGSGTPAPGELAGGAAEADDGADMRWSGAAKLGAGRGGVESELTARENSLLVLPRRASIFGHGTSRRLAGWEQD